VKHNSSVEPAKVHGGLVQGYVTAIRADVGPSPVILKRDANFRIMGTNKVEVEIRVLAPFGREVLHFLVLLRGALEEGHA
jgi:hypothetical protein